MGGDGEKRAAVAIGVAGFDFDEMQVAAVGGDEIDLAQAAAPILFNDAVALLLQEPLGERFAVLADLSVVGFGGWNHRDAYPRTRSAPMMPSMRWMA